MGLLIQFNITFLPPFCHLIQTHCTLHITFHIETRSCVAVKQVHICVGRTWLLTWKPSATPTLAILSCFLIHVSVFLTGSTHLCLTWALLPTQH